ncbi:MAG: magnesium chelatase subunit D family protein [Caloramator sp.]|nr:magnesium chelatase subunit D family protein [Caloramator sp.]
MSQNYVFPFVAVVGQEKIKKALILNIINPAIGGVLISGEKGTAKSTLVRGIEEIGQNIRVVNLPLNATEDRLIGSINIEKAIAYGKKSFEPGILKEADGNVLYIDEVNLLSEHLINCLMDVSDSGINIIEREGISYKHMSRFVLIGTMNPEEGFLHTSFLDRFGLYVEAKGCYYIHERKEVIKRRLEYEKNPIEYINKWKKETNKLRKKIINSKKFLNEVEISKDNIEFIVQIVKNANCAGHRGEIVIIETAKAIAAFDNRKNITIEDIKLACEYALPHRIRDFDSNSVQSEDKVKDNQNYDLDDIYDLNYKEHQNNKDCEEKLLDNFYENENYNNNSMEKSAKQIVEYIGEVFNIKSFKFDNFDRKKRKGNGRRSNTKTTLRQGRYIKYIYPKDKVKDIAIDATLRAAAPYQSLRDKQGLAVSICKSDIKEKVREKRIGNTILFVVDASGSMRAKKRMVAVKGAIISLLKDAYQKRDKVGMVAFKGKNAEILLDITRSVELAQKKLKELPTGGKTPLSAGLYKGYKIIMSNKKKNPDILPIIVLITDGRANVAINGNNPIKEALEISQNIAKDGIKSIVIDTENELINFGLAKEIAQVLKAQYYKLEDIEAKDIIKAVKNNV